VLPTNENGRGDLSKQERKDYTDAVLCLQSKGPALTASLAPGARSKFDDYVVIHILQTGINHDSVSCRRLF